MATFVTYGGEDILCNDVLIGVSQPAGQNPTGGGVGISPPGGAVASVKYTLRGVDFNKTSTDTPLILNLPTGAKNYVVEFIYLTNASHTLVTATVGVFSAAGGTGTTFAADQAITVTNGTANTALNTQALTLTPAATIAFNFNTLYVRVGTPEGAAATADVTVGLHLLG